MGRGDGELGEKLAQENEEQGDLILGHHRFSHLIVMLLLVMVMLNLVMFHREVYHNLPYKSIQAFLWSQVKCR